MGAGVIELVRLAEAQAFVIDISRTPQTREAVASVTGRDNDNGESLARNGSNNISN